MKFNINSPVFEFLTTLSEFILLNVIFILTCLPIFTIGTSITALYYVTMREARTEHGYIVRGYFKAWRQNFIQGTGIFAIFFIIGSILIFNLNFWYQLNISIAPVIFILLVLTSIIAVILFLYSFPLLARFQNTVKQTLKNVLPIALQNIKQTLLLILMNSVFIFLCVVIPQAKIFMVLLGFSFFAYCNSFLFIRIFKQYEPSINSEDLDP